MRAINIFILLAFIFLNACSSLEVAEVLTKTSIKVAENVAKSAEKMSGNNNKIQENANLETLDDEEKSVLIKKKKEKEAAQKQKQITSIKFIGRSLADLTKEFGNPSLIRVDGNTKTVRFDTKTCRLFLYFHINNKKNIAEFYEIRNLNGNLIERKANINRCYQEIKKV